MRIAQKTGQQLAPKTLLLSRLFEMPTALIEQRVKKELEANPMLELDDAPDDLGEVDDFEAEPSANFHYLSKGTSAIDVETSFYEYLAAQVGLQQFTENEKVIADYIVGSLDHNGYLRRSVEEVVHELQQTENLTVTPEDVERVLAVVQQFEPNGVGARDLRECLLIQLRNKDNGDGAKSLAYKVLEQFYPEFVNRQYDTIIKRLRLASEDLLRSAVKEIQLLNPKPSNAFDGVVSRRAEASVPDIGLDMEEDVLTFRLNRGLEPKLRISSDYANIVRNYNASRTNLSREQREAAMFVKTKINEAKLFIDAVKQHREVLTKVMNVIFECQRDYFTTGDELKLKPLTQRQLVEQTGQDVSAISRLLSNKYVQTTSGIVPLKHFVVDERQTKNREVDELRELKQLLRDTVEAENKRQPLTDEQLAELVSEKFPIQRRALTKLREQLGIPAARFRKEI